MTIIAISSFINSCASPQYAATDPTGGNKNFTTGTGQKKAPNTETTSTTNGVNHVFYQDINGARLSKTKIQENLNLGIPNGGVDTIHATSPILGVCTYTVGALTAHDNAVHDTLTKEAKVADINDLSLLKRLGKLTPITVLSGYAPNDTRKSAKFKLYSTDGTGSQCDKNGNEIVTVVSQKQPLRRRM